MKTKTFWASSPCANLLEEWVVASLHGTAQIRAIEASPVITYDLINRDPITVFPWESARGAAERMAEHKVGRLVVVDPENPSKPISIVTRSDLLKPAGPDRRSGKSARAHPQRFPFPAQDVLRRLCTKTGTTLDPLRSQFDADVRSGVSPPMCNRQLAICEFQPNPGQICRSQGY